MLLLTVFCVLLLTIYLWHANRAISTTPPEAAKLAQKSWTEEQVQEAYRKAQTSPIDVKPYLFRKKNRRYIVVGGSGLVGGWIVEHLLMRGEAPNAIRILDLKPVTRRGVIDAAVDFVQTDITVAASVDEAFRKQWPVDVESLPLTVFHCAAYIDPRVRAADFLPLYQKINIDGAKNVLMAAEASKASCFISTSSASVGVRRPQYFPWPWQRWPKDIFQILPNADPQDITAPPKSFGSCYAWSKAQAENIVCEANDAESGFLTGSIRPGHAIYGHGVESSNSLTWDYLSRGGNPTWIQSVVTQFVNAQNVSIGHLAYEDALIEKINPGGKAYCVTDPNPAILYGDLYRTLIQLAHPLTPISFPHVPHILMLLPAYFIEQYTLLRHRYLSFLPPVTGDISFLQPAVFKMCTLHLVYTDTAAQEEIRYVAPIKTIDGFALAVLDWNEKVEARARANMKQVGRGEIEVQNGSAIPKGPSVH